jgi:GAF domain-containing protein
VLDRRTIHVADLQAEVDDYPELVDQTFETPVRFGDSLTVRVVRERQVVHSPDVQTGPDVPERVRRILTSIGAHSWVGVPMLREGDVIGAITVSRRDVKPFTEGEIGLLQTFASQAVIAIENVRLFTELESRNRDLTAAHAQVTESLEQQTATAETLRVIASSPTELQPVMEAVAENAARVCGATDSVIFRLDGEILRFVAQHGALPRPLSIGDMVPTRRGHVSGRAVLERRTIHVEDLLALPETEFPETRALARESGFTQGLTLLATPLLREGVALGAILIRRAEARPFSTRQIELLETFASQAVIAIENVRLFKELEAKTRDLTRSVGELRALGVVGRALSSTLDLDTVLQTIVTRASQLAGADACSVFEYGEATEAFHLRATHNLDPEVVTLTRRTLTRKGEGVQGRMAVTRQPVQIPDIAAEDAYRGPLRDILLRTGTRARRPVAARRRADRRAHGQ